MLPVINEYCVKQAIKTGIGLKAKINKRSVFDRKNYFYADLPQGYQISQFKDPIVGEGKVILDMPDGQKEVGIERLHLEQDAGKSIHDLDPKNTFKLTRAFSHFMNFMNLAELVDASRSINENENSKKKLNKKNLFIEEIFEDLFRKKNISDNKIYDLAKNLNIGIVLTAHPTEVKRRTLIQKYHKIIEILEERELFKNFPSKLKVLDKNLYDELTIIWNTDDLKRFKPSPFDEARWGLAIIEDSLWDTVPKVYRKLNSIFVKNMGKNLPKNFNPIVFGSWMGGDRDGNPNVTSEVTRKVILLSRWEAAKLYEKALTKIIRSYSME